MAIHRKSAVWRDYQERAAELFRRMGFDATVEEILEGARGKHEVDVVARTTLGGVAVMWIVECKYWKSAVPKAHVLTLAQVVQDIGADRGILLSEKGFQAGAISASRKSNVLLTSLQELVLAAADSIADLSIKRSLLDVKCIEKELRAILLDHGPRAQSALDIDQIITLLGACLEVTMAVMAAQTGRFPVRLPSTLSDEPRWADELPAFAEALALDVEEISTRYGALKPQIVEELKPHIKNSGELIHLVRDLMAAGAELAPPSTDAIAEELKLQAVVAAMRAVGGCAKTLRSAPSATISKRVHGLMRELIDGAYVWFADPNRTQENWRELTMRTDQAVARLAEAVEKIHAGD